MNNFDLTLATLTEGKAAACCDKNDNGACCKITIEKDKSTGEYRCPAKNGKEAGAAYDDDKESIIGTAKHIYGDDVVIKFKTVPEFVGGKYEDRKPAKKKKAVKK